MLVQCGRLHMAALSHIARLTTQAGPIFRCEIIVHACAMILAYMQVSNEKRMPQQCDLPRLFHIWGPCISLQNSQLESQCLTHQHHICKYTSQMFEFFVHVMLENLSPDPALSMGLDILVQ